MSQIESLIPGMGQPVVVRLEASCAAVNRTLAEINLRGRTGATVLTVVRGEQAILPGPGEKLAAGDVLTLTGTDEAITAAAAVLRLG